MLKHFPEISTYIRNLYLIGTAIEQVPPSIRSWSRLDELKMSYFENLKEFPHALERITCMCLTDTEIQELPPWVKKISRLSVFVLKGCRKLVTLPAISESIRYMDASDCKSLEILECSFLNQYLTLNFANCFKLSQEARNLIIQNSCRYAVLPGGQVPPHFTHRATGAGPLTIKLNEKPLPKYMIFKACILLVYKVDHDACSEENSMEVDVIYQNSNKKLYPALAEHLYIFRVEAEVTSSELFFEFKLKRDDVWKIGECGLVRDVECISLCFYSTIYICTWNSNVAEEINVTHVLTDITIEEPDPRGSAEMKRMKLRWLRLEGCIRLEVLPTNINLESLLELNLSDCSMLKSFPQISTNLEKLNLRGTAIEQVPPSIRSWPHLKELHMSYFENLKEFPHALERITSLSLTDTEIQEVPPLVKQISRLNRFFLSGCRKLVTLPPISESTHSIYANDCDSLEILECSFSDQIRRLNFANCFKLNQEARDLIIQSNSTSAVLPGGQVPEYFTHRATGGGPLTIKLNQNPLPESMTFKACILLLNKGDHEACSKEKSRGVDVVNNNIIFGLYPALAEHLYTFRINLEVTSRKLLFEFKLMSDDDDWKIGECGIVQQ
ncbi:hypothetical protein YC2023_026720 [Brassica napus]